MLRGPTSLSAGNQAGDMTCLCQDDMIWHNMILYDIIRRLRMIMTTNSKNNDKMHKNDKKNARHNPNNQR